MCETIKATDAVQNGLITNLFNSDVFESEIVHQLEQIALQSSQVIFLFIKMIHSGMGKQKQGTLNFINHPSLTSIHSKCMKIMPYI